MTEIFRSPLTSPFGAVSRGVLQYARTVTGTLLVGCIYLTHQREDLYPEPKQFKPERFLERQFSPYEFIPFGGGARRCIGEALAQFEMKLVLATILSCYQLALAEQKPVQPQRRGVTLAPAGGVKMVLTGRVGSFMQPLEIVEVQRH